MRSAPPTERSFGLSVGTVCILAGGLSWWRGHIAAAVALTAIGLVLVVGGLLAPGALRGPNRVWWRFAQALGWVNARILLSAFFFLVLTPIGLLMRALGRNPLSRIAGRSGWSTYSVRRANPKHYEQMF
jgi:hypothetical protein